MRKVLICALALGGFAASAQAADLSVDSLKDMTIPSLTVAGITLYGTIDVGYGYAENGAPIGGGWYAGLPLTAYANKMGYKSTSSLDENMLSQSAVGVKIEENVGAGFVAIGKLETQFNPLTGELADACESIVQNIKLPLQQQTINADGSRCGQAFGGQAWGGVSNASYGSLTFGRQNSLENDNLGKYDAMGQSYALSLLGFTATDTAGAGATELSRWDNSVKYVYQYGPAHVAGQYSNGGQDTGIFGNAFGANAGAAWKGFSADVVYQKENGEAGLSNGVNYADTTASQILKGTLTDGELWSVMGKYTYDFGGGFKDEGPVSKITFYGGYAHVEMTNYGTSVNAYEPTIGGYAPGTYGGTWNSSPYNPGQSRILETEWAGAKYEMGQWAFAVAYYHLTQNQYVAAGNATCAANYSAANNGPANPQPGQCAGEFDQVSALVDYTFSKNFDVYAGASWSDIHGGLASDWLKNQNAGVVTGMRIKF